MTGVAPVAIITGASSPVGIGAAIARRLASAGWRLVLVAEGPADDLDQVAAECRQLSPPGGDAVAHLADLGDPGAATSLVDVAVAQFGRVDALVNNAGLRIFKKFGDFTCADFDASVAVNLRAPFLTSQAVLPVMRRQGGGRIVHVASQLGSVSFPTRGLYGLTKAALIHLTKTMALELARENIIVNAISPGPIRTAIAMDREIADPEAAQARLDHVPMGRMGRPEEVADIVFMLLTTSATYLTGHDLIVDGGYTLH